MNNWQYDQYSRLDELSRQRITAEINAERLVRQYRTHHPGMFGRAMIMLATWMISVGRGLRSRYEIPSANCTRTSLGTYAK